MKSLLALLVLSMSFVSFASDKVTSLSCSFDKLPTEKFELQIKELTDDYDLMLLEDYESSIVLMNQAAPLSTVSKNGTVIHLVNVLNKASKERYDEGDPQTLRERDNNIEIYGYQTGFDNIALVLTGSSGYTKGYVEYDYEQGFDINKPVTCTKK